MPAPVYQPTTPLRLGETVYTAQVWGVRRDDGLWDGWIEFVPSDAGAILSTDRETTQSSLDALTYWATGLEPVYLDGALARAIANSRRRPAA